MHTVTRESRALESHMLGYQYFMSSYRVPRHIETKITQWVRFQHTEQLGDSQKKAVLSDPTLPPEFRISLARSLRNDLFSQIPFLVNIPEAIRAKFTAELLLKATTCYFAAETIIGDSSEKANCLMIVQKGHVEMCQPIREGGRVLQTLKRGYARQQKILASISISLIEEK